MKRLILLSAILMLGVVAPLGVADQLVAHADDAPGCEGLSEYSTQMLAIRKDSVEDLERIGITDDRDQSTFSSDDWQAYADWALNNQREIKEVTPPSFAREWHEVLIQSYGIRQQIGLTAAKSGYFSLLAFTDRLDELEAKGTQAANAGIAQCSDLATFFKEWNALNGRFDATPIASPVATPE